MSLHCGNMFFQKRDNIEGKKENTLIFECGGCNTCSNSFFNKTCLSCLFNGIYSNRKKRFKKIYVEVLDLTIELDVIKLFMEFFKNLSNIKRKYEKLRSMNCVWEDFNCKIFSDLNSFVNIQEDVFYNPILLFQEISKKLGEIKKIKKKRINDTICIDCVDNIQDQLNEIKYLTENSDIIIKFEDFQKNTTTFDNTFSFYEYLLTKSYRFSDNEDIIFKNDNFNNESNRKLIDVYRIGKNSLYEVQIFEIRNFEEKIYKIDPYFESQSNVENFKRYIDQITKKIPILNYKEIISLENLIKLYKKEALRIIELKFDIFEEKKKKIAFLSVIKFLNFEKLFPVLIDDQIEEIFLDSPNSYIYINHQKFGRCRTNISLTSLEIQRFITFLRLYSGQRLDYSHPSIKYVIKNKYFFCRFAIDIKPINVYDFSLDIRKLNKNILTIQDLLKFNTLSPLMASFIYFNVIRRVNITATGETDTGKTTLINSFDLIAPDYLRKVYVENVVESLDQGEFNKHQLKYQSDSLENTDDKKQTKSQYIKTLLHRSPDIIFLGEILTKEEADAMFHCLSAGLRGFQTLHSNTIDSFINRIIHHFKIDHSCLDDLDLILLLKKDFNKRRIVSVVELDINNFHEAGKYYREIFEYNPDTIDWDNHKKLYETNTIQKLKKYESLDREKFELYLFFYKEVFEFLLISDKISNKSMTELFRNISYYSRRSIDLLKRFWTTWKEQYKLKINN